MKHQGNVKGAIYPIEQIEYVKPDETRIPMPAMKTKKCVMCGNEITNPKNYKYCSPKCRYEAERMRRRKRSRRYANL